MSDLNQKQMATLEAVCESGNDGRTAAEVAAILDVKTVSVTSTLTSLVRKGLLTKTLVGGIYQPVESASDNGDSIITVDGVKVAEVSHGDITDTAKVPALLADATSKAMTLQEAGAERKLTTDPRWVRCIKAENGVWLTVDGKFVTAKDGDDKKAPWTLYSVHAGHLTHVGTFATSADAVLVETLNS